MLVTSTAPALAQGGDPPTPTATPTAEPPIELFLGQDTIDLYRIENAWECGDSAEACMWSEPDALVMARIAMGEAPQSFGDRVFVMWIIKMRAALGFKEAGYYAGARSMFDRWGPETSIKVEALCSGGCQFSPARIADGIYFPCDLRSGNPMRGMLCPTDEQLIDFHFTYEAAVEILDAHLDDFPQILRGYDGFRSPTVTWHGTINRQGGLSSRIFFAGGNVWRDEYDKDNIFWTDGEGYTTPSPTPTATPTATPTVTSRDLSEFRQRDILREREPEPPAPETNQQEADIMFLKRVLAARAMLVALALMALFSLAFIQVSDARIEEIIAGIISTVIMLFGPRPLGWLYDKMNIPKGSARELATYAVAAVVGLVALLVAGAFVNAAWDLETLMALAGVLATAAKFAYHRLKDLHGPSLAPPPGP